MPAPPWRRPDEGAICVDVAELVVDHRRRVSKGVDMRLGIAIRRSFVWRDDDDGGGGGLPGVSTAAHADGTGSGAAGAGHGASSHT
jgi:hypothetical protein